MNTLNLSQYVQSDEFLESLSDLGFKEIYTDFPCTQKNINTFSIIDFEFGKFKNTESIHFNKSIFIITNTPIQEFSSLLKIHKNIIIINAYSGTSGILKKFLYEKNEISTIQELGYSIFEPWTFEQFEHYLTKYNSGYFRLFDEEITIGSQERIIENGIISHLNGESLKTILTFGRPTIHAGVFYNTAQERQQGLLHVGISKYEAKIQGLEFIPKRTTVHVIIDSQRDVSWEKKIKEQLPKDTTVLFHYPNFSTTGAIHNALRSTSLQFDAEYLCRQIFE